MLDEIKVEPIKPLIISKIEMQKMAKEIVEQKIKWFWEGNPNYWLITISPEGEIIKPTKDTPGHPHLAEKVIFKNDILLQKLYDYYVDIGEIEEARITKSSFMIAYGYINVDGYYPDMFSAFAYNSQALTPYTNQLPERFRRYFIAEVSDLEEALMLSNIEKKKMFTIPRMKNRILDMLDKKYNIRSKDQINEFLTYEDEYKLFDVFDEMYSDIESEYKNIHTLDKNDIEMEC